MSFFLFLCRGGGCEQYESEEYQLLHHNDEKLNKALDQGVQRVLPDDMLMHLLHVAELHHKAVTMQTEELAKSVGGSPTSEWADDEGEIAGVEVEGSPSSSSTYPPYPHFYHSCTHFG